MRAMCSREIFTKKCLQQQIFNSDLKGAWHYNHVTFTSITKTFTLYCRLIYMLSILCVRLTIKVKVGIAESFKVGWYTPKKTGSSHLNKIPNTMAGCIIYHIWQRPFPGKTTTIEVEYSAVQQLWHYHIFLPGQYLFTHTCFMVKNQANNLPCTTKPLKKACIQLTQASKIWEWFVQPTSWNSHFFEIPAICSYYRNM